jgi:hypothetical protein
MGILWPLCFSLRNKTQNRQNTAGGFVGSIYAMYATSLGWPSSSTASFDWFEYDGKDVRD